MDLSIVMNDEIIDKRKQSSENLTLSENDSPSVGSLLTLEFRRTIAPHSSLMSYLSSHEVGKLQVKSFIDIFYAVLTNNVNMRVNIVLWLLLWYNYDV